MPKLVETPEQATENIRAFYRNPIEYGGPLWANPSQVRGWYAVPDSETWAFGPSRIIGYERTALRNWLAGKDKGWINGGATQDQLANWFRPLTPTEPMYAAIHEALEGWLAPDFKPNKISKVHVLIENPTLNSRNPTTSRSSHASPDKLREIDFRDIPSRVEFKELTLELMRRGLTNSEDMRNKIANTRKIALSKSYDTSTPSGKFRNEHAWVLGKLNKDELIIKLNEEEYCLPGTVTPPDSETDIADGAARRTMSNSYERNPLNRKRCLAIWGYSCQCCGCTMEELYGPAGRQLIHVHHLVPLGDGKGARPVNPKRDLRPVCPNCHMIIHGNKDEPRSIDEVKELFARARKRRLSRER